jgi:hypothetical protein
LYVAANPLRFTDPTGHYLDDGSGGGGGIFDYDSYDPWKPLKKTTEQYATTSEVFLKGGPEGVQSLSQRAEEGWDGYTGSGASDDPKIAGRVGAFEIFNTMLPIIRDNTNIREKLGVEPELSGQVYYEGAYLGWILTQASITNNSQEPMTIAYIRAEIYAGDPGTRKLSTDKLYPYSYTTLQHPGYGTAKPNSTSSPVSLTSAIIYNGQNVIVTISVITPSGRTGRTSVNIYFNP